MRTRWNCFLATNGRKTRHLEDCGFTESPATCRQIKPDKFQKVLNFLEFFLQEMGRRSISAPICFKWGRSDKICPGYLQSPHLIEGIELDTADSAEGGFHLRPACPEGELRFARSDSIGIPPPRFATGVGKEREW